MSIFFCRAKGCTVGVGTKGGICRECAFWKNRDKQLGEFPKSVGGYTCNQPNCEHESDKDSPCPLCKMDLHEEALQRDPAWVKAAVENNKKNNLRDNEGLLERIGNMFLVMLSEGTPLEKMAEIDKLKKVG